jgi:aromatic-L-amino-acid decarboxylase
VLDWLVELLGLPDRFMSLGAGGGVIQDSASSAVLCALLAARERATDGTSNKAGVNRRLTVYASTQAHSSIEKAVRIAGIGSDALRFVEVDEDFAMRPDELERMIEQDLFDGATPCMVVATVGTTSSNALDPLRGVGEISRRHNLWLHVDAAMSGSAAVCPEFRFIHEGVELADSYGFNPHKWMFVNFDCSCFYVADREALVGALSILPEYLRNVATESGTVIDYRDWQVPLGRRFRALKLWFVIRHYGADGLRQQIRGHVDLAHELASWISDDPTFELAAPVPLNLVCFRHLGGDDANRQLMERLNDSGAMFLTHTKLDDKFTLRMSIGQTNTRREHVEKAWAMIRSSPS